MVTPSPDAPVTKHNASAALVDTRGLESFGGAALAAQLTQAAQKKAAQQVLGDGPRWLSAIAELEKLGPALLHAAMVAPRLTSAEAVATAQGPDFVKRQLLELCPWRKGPFDVFGVSLDAEWRCDRKWARVNGAVSFAGKTLLDVGSGNGYYLLRALGAGARAVLGIDPTWLYVAQFAALRRSYQPQAVTEASLPAWVLPLALEDVPQTARLDADVVLSMGVLYHRKSPIEHLEALRPHVREGGTLVLETLVVPGDERTVLVPKDRYAAMRNVWMIPSVAAACLWLSRCGYRDVQVVDVTPTSPDEQRATEFMTSASLCDFLDPQNPALTIEGYPAPMRAIFLARRG